MPFSFSFFLEHRSHRAAQRFLDRGVVGALGREQLLQRGQGGGARLREPRLVQPGDAAAQELRIAQQGARLAVQHAQADQHAAVGQELAVAEHHLAHVRERAARVQVDAPGRGAAGHHGRGLPRAQLDDVAVLGDQAAARVDPGRFRGARVRGEHAELSVDGHERARAHQVDHHPLLALAGMAGGVDELAAVPHRGEHAAPAPDEVVDEVGDVPLVAGNAARRQDDQVALLQLDRGVLAEREAAERAVRLSLCPGADHSQLARREVVGGLRIDEQLGRTSQVAHLQRQADVLLHRAPQQAHLAAVLERGSHHALHAVDVGAERRHHDAPARVRRAEDARHRLGHLALRDAGPLPLRIRRIAEQAGDALLSQLREAAHVEQAPIGGRPVHLEIPGVHHHPRRRPQRVADRVRNGMGHLERLDLQTADAGHGARGHLDEPRRDAVLGELLLHHGECVAGAAHRGVRVLAQEVRQRADVVLVGVGEQHRRHRRSRRAQVREVGRDDLDAERGLAAGEEHAAVHHHARLGGLDREAVHAHLAQAAERDEAHGCGGGLHGGAT